MYMNKTVYLYLYIYTYTHIYIYVHAYLNRIQCTYTPFRECSMIRQTLVLTLNFGGYSGCVMKRRTASMPQIKTFCPWPKRSQSPNLHLPPLASRELPIPHMHYILHFWYCQASSPVRTVPSSWILHIMSALCACAENEHVEGLSSRWCLVNGSQYGAALIHRAPKKAPQIRPAILANNTAAAATEAIVQVVEDCRRKRSNA